MRLIVRGNTISAHHMQELLSWLGKNVRRCWFHSACTPYMVLVFSHVCPRVLKHNIFRAPLDFNNKDRAPNGFHDKAKSRTLAVHLNIVSSRKPPGDSPEAPYADRLSSAGRAVLSTCMCPVDFDMVNMMIGSANFFQLILNHTR
jgi:hypothetical protein